MGGLNLQAGPKIRTLENRKGAAPGSLLKALVPVILAAMSNGRPPWVIEAVDFCRNAGIKIVAFGPDMLTVEAKSPERAKEIASQLALLGFKTIQNEDNTQTGLLDLSPDPEAVRARMATFDVSRRPWLEQIAPILWAAYLFLFLILSHDILRSGRHPYLADWLLLVIGVWRFLQDAGRIWGWRLEILPEGLRIRRWFRWSMIPWNEIRAIDSFVSGWGWGRDATVELTTSSSATERLGSFRYGFARDMRNRLRYELSQRQQA